MNLGSEGSQDIRRASGATSAEDVAGTSGHRLAGKVAIVTGAGSRSSGIGNGRAMAILFARQGASVALIDSEPNWLDETLHTILREGGDTIALNADVTDPASCRNAVRSTVNRWGHLDVLVNNVGIAGPAGNAIDVDLSAWEPSMRVNVSSMMLMAKFAIPEMKRGRGGAIINIGSAAGMIAITDSLFYPTSKGAVIQMTRAMAAHHGADGIRVNCIAPGLLYTPMATASGVSSELREARRLATLLQTEGNAWDVANAALYLASDEARWVTGIVLPVDGGLTAGRLDLPVPRSGTGGHRTVEAAADGT